MSDEEKQVILTITRTNRIFATVAFSGIATVSTTSASNVLGLLSSTEVRGFYPTSSVILGSKVSSGFGIREGKSMLPVPQTTDRDSLLSAS